MMTRRQLALSVAAGAALSLALTGCGKAMEPYNDAPVGTQNKGSADIMNFPDGFSNVAAKCDGTTRVYVVFHADLSYGAVAAVPNSPECAP